jgi:hypothetical protein
MLGACYALAVQTLQAQRSGPEIIDESETAGLILGTATARQRPVLCTGGVKQSYPRNPSPTGRYSVLEGVADLIDSRLGDTTPLAMSWIVSRNGPYPSTAMDGGWATVTRAQSRTSSGGPCLVSQ